MTLSNTMSCWADLVVTRETRHWRGEHDVGDGLRHLRHKVVFRVLKELGNGRQPVLVHHRERPFTTGVRVYLNLDTWYVPE